MANFLLFDNVSMRLLRYFQITFIYRKLKAYIMFDDIGLWRKFLCQLYRHVYTWNFQQKISFKQFLFKAGKIIRFLGWCHDQEKKLSKRRTIVANWVLCVKYTFKTNFTYTHHTITLFFCFHEIHYCLSSHFGLDQAFVELVKIFKFNPIFL